ncbi:MAG TPA: CopD family protein [Methylomirabilota bacterium]
MALGALGVAVAQGLSLGLTVAALDVPAGTLLARLAATQYFHASLARVLAAGVVGGAALALRGGARGQRWTPLALLGVVALVVDTAWMSHSAARLGDRAALLALSALHQLAASVWVGGQAHLLVALCDPRVPPAKAWTMGRRFSALAVVAVGALVAGGLGLSIAYVDGPRGLAGTSYGLMVLTKGVLLGGLLVLGGLNFRALRARWDEASSVRLRRLVEVELGVGLTVLFAAASLTSLPPAIDVVADRATPAEVLTRFTPRWPSLSSPPLDAVPVGREAARTDADRQWSEYNHHVSGLFVLLMGALSLIALAGVRAAGHWPLLFLGLAGFILLRSDPDAWPLGPQGFWAGMGDVEVWQHRVFVLIVVALGLGEWAARRGRLRSPWVARTFPLLCAVGGGLLLVHGHVTQDVKNAFLLEVTHAPLGVLGLVVGWGRWLEVRLAPPASRMPGWLSATAMVAIGTLLLLYRES